ncbi:MULTISPECIES: hypothetical protein [Sphingobacterium]|uniref:Uncharacterized protein n=2 Tax=Sphingobacterium TaxID=28453 RepID=A0A0B8T519_9SPHI|nr:MULTISPECIES: hypothetical protein [Sphingobacterium]KGE12484.1 hypothetical protein DI53_3749 [Sphingobacterium deserti]WDF67121.1 hypothetical protein PQ465_12470 [Sphingobacterium sp. KACC 22765]
MEYFDRESAFEFEMIGNNKIRCWHMTGGSIDITVTIMQDKSLSLTSENGNISEENNQKLFNAIDRAYKHWNLI